MDRVWICREISPLEDPDKIDPEQTVVCSEVRITWQPVRRTVFV